MNCCENPDVTGRWYYVGGKLSIALAYCKNCDAGWRLSENLKVLVRK